MYVLPYTLFHVVLHTAFYVPLSRWEISVSRKNAVLPHCKRLALQPGRWLIPRADSHRK